MILLCQRWIRKMQEFSAYIHSHGPVWETIPPYLFFFGPAVSCPEINDETLGKISKTFSSII